MKPITGFDLFDDDAPEVSAAPTLSTGEGFKVDGKGDVWIVERSHGASGYVRRATSKRKWFSFLHDRTTDTIEILPSNGMGEITGPNIASGKVARVK